VRPAVAGRLALALLPLLAACERDRGEPLVERQWTLVWQDEFDGPADQPPDPAKWGHDVGTGWGNQQLEYDTADPANSSLDGLGRLAIVARESDPPGGYTSARLVTRDLFEPRYGRFEARVRQPVGRGLWPAFWLLGADIATVGWPACGEIDVMEYRGQEPTVLHNSLHGPGYSGAAAVTRRVDRAPARLDADFHVYGVEWTEDCVRWTFDGETTFEARAEDLPGEWVFDRPFYLILNLAVGGAFVGPPDGATSFPQTLLVDWVRVHQLLP